MKISSEIFFLTPKKMDLPYYLERMGYERIGYVIK